MVVRLLVVVLTVVGAVPVRFCTCGASHHHHYAPVPPPCGHDHGTADPSPAAAPDPPDHHDADCHAVKPRPLMSLGLQFDVTDVPPADALSVALAELAPPAPAVGEHARDCRPPPNRPLFISHCSLRN